MNRLDFTTEPSSYAISAAPPLNLKATEVVKNLSRSTLHSMGSERQATNHLLDCLSRTWQAVCHFFKSLLSYCGLQTANALSPTEREERIGPAETIQNRLTRQMQRSMGQMAKEPVKPMPYLIAPGSWDAHEEVVGGLNIGFSHVQGKRPTMEDEHLAVSFNLKVAGRDYPVQLFGIFDGHGGPLAAQFVRDHLKKKLQETLIEYNPQGLSDAGIWNALKMTSVRLNKDFKKQYKQIANSQGTTATIAMILDHKLWTANIGDSRTVLDNCGTPFQCTEDAKPQDERYKQGIEHRGGTVVDRAGVPRVNGVLAIARAIGDHGLNGAVSARPKITMKPLAEIQRGSHLILCCDGIFDVSGTVDVVKPTHQYRNLPAKVLAGNITYSAHEAGSKDNLSAMVVKIK
jgi:serine/threonine protein phosphatase PrpC